MKPRNVVGGGGGGGGGVLSKWRTAMDSFLPTICGNSLIRAILNRNWPEVSKLVQRSPSMARTLFRYHCEDGPIVVVLPLHICLRMNNPPSHVVQQLIKAYPISVRMCEYSESPRHSNFYYPMHIACGATGGGGGDGSSSSGPINVQVVEALLDVFPDAAMIKDKTGRLPLHHALTRNAPPECILRLVESFPWSASVRDTNGWFPLHLACAMGYGTLVIRSLIQSCPDVMERRCAKKTPYEIACHKSKVENREILELLFVDDDEQQDLVRKHSRYSMMIVSTVPSSGRILI
jgi:hypothetical protein